MAEETTAPTQDTPAITTPAGTPAAEPGPPAAPITAPEPPRPVRKCGFRLTAAVADNGKLTIEGVPTLAPGKYGVYLEPPEETAGAPAAKVKAE
jgi:hypothetical protein